MSGTLSPAFTGLRLGMGEGIAGKVLSLGRAVTSEDYTNDPSITHTVQEDHLLRQDGLRAHAAVPLKIGEEIRGSLGVANKRVQQFHEREVELLQQLANQAAVAMENARLYAQVEEMAVLEERQWIAREMHDGLGQVLAYLGFKSREIENLLAAGRVAQAQGGMGEVRKIVESAYDEVKDGVLALGSRDASEEALRRNVRLALWAGAGGVLSAIVAHSTLGAVFGLVGAKSFWYGPYMPIYLILSALVAGAAILALVTLLVYRLAGREMSAKARELVMDLGRLLLLFLGIHLFVLLLKTIVGLYGDMPGSSEALMLLVKGPLSLLFWGLEVFIGILFPLFILLNPRTRTVFGVGLASVLAVIGLFAARYDLVIAGQLVPVMAGTETLHYAPSYTEALIVVGVFAFCAFLYTLGERVLPLGEPG